MGNKITYFIRFITYPLSLKKKREFFYMIDGSFVFFIPSLIIYNILQYLPQFYNSIVKPKLDFPFFIYIIIIAPVFEELIFRLSLKKSKKNLIISSISCLSYILIRLFYFNKLNTVDYILCILCCYFSLNIFTSQKRYFKIHFHLLNLIFALLHIFNYVIEVKFIPIYFFGVLNYLILGFVFSYYRLYYSFKINLIMHVCYNFLALIPLVFKV